ncbi:MAG TPA: amidohydrolase family protein [Sphingomicrobium sp.]|jgi:predicted TIM-barrel fold metal-dependent hydrolase
MKSLFSLSSLFAAACATPQTSSRTAPLVDYHQHLVSADFAAVAKLPQRDGAALVRELDAAGIERALVLSVGYTYGDERKKLSEPDARTSRENDWTSAEVIKHAPRLVGFCSANPLRDAALQELERCLALPGMTGIKQHFGNGGVSLRNPDHLKRAQAVFALAQRHRAPILIHMRARGGTDYGAEDARILIEQVLPMAPSVDVIVAHLGASSPGYTEQNDAVMEVFANAARAKDPRIRNLFVDTGANIDADTTAEQAALAARRMRDFGVSRILYGSDLSAPGGSIGAGWQLFRAKMPLTATEFRTIMSNRRPFLR